MLEKIKKYHEKEQRHVRDNSQMLTLTDQKQV